MKKYLLTLTIAIAAIVGSMATALTAQAGPAPAKQADETIPWTEITLEMPGSLGFEALYVFDKLSDIEHLRVIGTLNEADWNSIKNMTSLVNLDLSKATATNIPQSQFDGRGAFKTFYMPQNVENIGKYAFKNTGLTTITIPKSVKSVGYECFRDCKELESVDWQSAAYIEGWCFSYCKKLKKAKLAEGITTIQERAFLQCEALSEFALPSTIVGIGAYALESTTSLKDIVLPESLVNLHQGVFQYSGITRAILPDKMNILESNIFNGCKSLEEVVMPSTIFKYDSSLFYNCTSLKKVTIPVATPPSTTNDIFHNVDKSQIELIVPEFAIVNYKLDNYWLQFENVKGGVESNYWALNTELALTNDRRMGGTPSIDLYSGAQLTIGGSAPAPFNAMRFQNNWRRYNDFQYAQMITNCANTTANSVQFETYIDNNCWYFITMPCDVKLSDVSHSEGAEFAVRYYDGESRAANGVGGSWKDVAAGSTLEAGKAYIFQTNREGWIILSADKTSAAQFLTSGDRSVAVNAWAGTGETASAADNGWNLIGNPNASYFDMAATSLSCPITVWNHRNNRYDAYSLIDDEVVLFPLQAFFMQQTDIDGTVTFASEGRQFTSEVARRDKTQAYDSESTRLLFNLQLMQGNEVADKTRVVLNENAQPGYEPACDASKFFPGDARTASLYTIDSEGNMLAINERPVADMRVRLGVKVPSAGKWAVKATRSDCTSMIEDSLTGTEFALTEGEAYEFTTDKAGDIDNRFSIRFENVCNGVNNVVADNSNLRIRAGKGAVIVSGAAGESIDIFTASGLKVASIQTAAAEETISLERGLYIVKTAKTSAKCAVR